MPPFQMIKTAKAVVIELYYNTIKLSSTVVYILSYMVVQIQYPYQMVRILNLNIHANIIEV